jgi:formate dehydrogenase maturation protein FdhE
MSERKKLEAKVRRLKHEREQLSKKGLKYDRLSAQISYWEEYLKEHDDSYIEKDAKFNWELCPISAKEPGRSFLDRGKMNDICRFKDCPRYETCWATKSTKPPTEILGG